MMTPARPAIAAVLIGMLLAVSGCGLRAAGTDGNLVDDWTPLGAPKFDLPSVGTCLSSPSKTPFDPVFGRADPIECDRGHTLEVVLIGTVEGNAAQATEPPAPGSEAFQAAYTACGAAVKDYVGGEWHDGMLGVNVQLPTRTPWTGGLRSYVCSTFALSSAYGVMSFSTGSLKGAMAGDAPKAMRCMEVNGTKASDGWWDKLNALTPIDCAQPHEGEFAGTVEVGTAGGAMPAADVLRKSTLDRCWTLGAKFVGLTESQFDARTEFGVSWDGIDKFQWDAGDHHVRCFVLTGPGKKTRGTIKGLGKKPLPI
ncbi:septum formation family protein [Dactylosporangium sp. NPDC049525]|uniref:septum formation family protein n=1 Tax=Dactylosporangium sp. NPDC049525 TaxID=3154730 RepID=UPI003424F8A7